MDYLHFLAILGWCLNSVIVFGIVLGVLYNYESSAWEDGDYGQVHVSLNVALTLVVVTAIPWGLPGLIVWSTRDLGGQG